MRNIRIPRGLCVVASLSKMRRQADLSELRAENGVGQILLQIQKFPARVSGMLVRKVKRLNELQGSLLDGPPRGITHNPDDDDDGGVFLRGARGGGSGSVWWTRGVEAVVLWWRACRRHPSGILRRGSASGLGWRCGCIVRGWLLPTPHLSWRCGGWQGDNIDGEVTVGGGAGGDLDGIWRQERPHGHGLSCQIGDVDPCDDATRGRSHLLSTTGRASFASCLPRPFTWTV